MANSSIRVATACTLGVALLMSSASVNALEKTATKEVDQASTGLGTEMKITAFSEGVKAAIAELVSRVNLFDGRIDTLEAWRTGIDTSVADILARLAALEARAPHLAYLYDTWRPWVEGQISSLNTSIGDINNRVTTLETGGGGDTVVTGPSCQNFGVGKSTKKVMISCPDNMFINGVTMSGLTTGDKNWSGTFKCCSLKVQ